MGEDGQQLLRGLVDGGLLQPLLELRGGYMKARSCSASLSLQLDILDSQFLRGTGALTEINRGGTAV
jgi:hypothetical protein